MKFRIDQLPIKENDRIIAPHFECSNGSDFSFEAAMITAKEQIVIQTPKPPITAKPNPKVNTPATAPATITSKPPRSASTPPIIDNQYAAEGGF